MIGQRELFDQREAIAFEYLATAVWAELQGVVETAEFYAGRANQVDAEIRRECGL